MTEMSIKEIIPSSVRAATPSRDVLSTHLDDEAVLLHVGTKRYYTLNPTGATIWSAIENGLSGEEILDRLCREFDVGADEAGRELKSIFAELTAKELIVVAAGV
jgi:hypothetical protein